MPSMFPEDFLWGVATSAYQIEGAVQAGGRGESIWDRFSHTPGAIADGSTGDVACDHYHRYRDDVQLLRTLGVNAYRFSIAWPRVQPDGAGPVNPAGLDFYDRLVDELLAAGVQPFPVLYHWDLPQQLQDRGGWANRDTSRAFAAYTEMVARRLGDRIAYWTTHNEMWCTAMLGYHLGVFAPGLQDIKLALSAAHHVLLSHGLAVAVLRSFAPRAQVGISPNMDYVIPASELTEDQAAARRYDGYFNRWFVEPLAGLGYPQDMWDFYGRSVPEVQPGDLETIAAPIDFLGLNYYNPSRIAEDPESPVVQVRRVDLPELPHTADREIYPQGLYETLVRLHRSYNFTRLMVTENGAAFPDTLNAEGRVPDLGRIDFLKAHLRQAARAVEDGVPLTGYFIWSLMDNFEWSQGYRLRYGLSYLEHATQQRIWKDSGLWYARFLAGREALSD